MDAVITPAQSFDHRQPIPGYTLIERIGAGGYGEVWKADAPGGLSKAVKIIFGQMDGTRAERELKSLNRMKLVQHPFLLSLERIEVVHGHLVIVSELAEGSLQDRFDRCRDDALPGIPREELLGYMRDTADALDFLYESQHLQHLDVKPENLLLLSRHIKVADFGLAKHVDEVDGSMVGGLTPLYAPPEMFDGRPNRHSDQYSLAIVFQHMLTGEPPFGGRTTAQLAAQHLRSKPIVSPLPEADQAAVTRALAKNPEKRFSCCRAFVDSLSNGSSAAASKIRRTTRTAPRIQGSNTSVLTPKRGRTRGAESSTVPTGHRANEYDSADSAPQIGSLPSLRLGNEPASGYRPTVVISLGGIGAEALRLLRGRLTDRFGDLDEVPALQLLALDTDVDALSARTNGSDRDALRLRETMAVPLCAPQQYRSKSKALLEWMNRRWLYNIPRSLRTEGIRPLGRLAFVDHFDAILDRLRCTVATATSAESVRQSSKSTGIDFAPSPPRVFIVSGISGGTGSGAVLDLAYTLRTVLTELGMSDRELIGILLHSTGRRAAARDLAICNTVACLSELDYFGGPDGFYPGEPACGIEAFRQDSAAFRQLYLVHLGDEIGQDGLDAGAANVAEYLYQSTATAAGAFFDGSRWQNANAQETTGDQGMTLRSFGLVRLRNSLAEASRVGGDALCRTLIKKWIGGTDALRAEQTVRLADMKALVAAQGSQQRGLDSQVSQIASQFATSLELDLEHLLALAIETVARELRSPEEYLQGLINETRERLGFHDRPSANRRAAQSVLETIDGILVGKGEGLGDQSHETLQSVLDSRLAQVVDIKIQALRKWLLQAVDNPHARLHGANQAAAWFRDHVESLRKDTQRVRDRLEEQATVLERRIKEGTACQTGKRKTPDDDPRGDGAFLHFARLRFEQAMHRSIVFALQSMNTSLYETIDGLAAIRNHLGELASNFEETPLSDEMASKGLHDLSVFGENQLRIVSEFDCQIQARCFGEGLQLSTLFEAPPEDVSTLLTAMRDQSRCSIERTIRDLNLKDRISGQKDDDVTNDTTLRDYLAEATPKRMAEWGGAKRLLLTGSESFAAQFEIVKQKVQKIAQHDSNIVTDSEGDVVLCYEVQEIELEAVLRSLIGERFDYLDIAARLHSRIDVDWPELNV